jgi:hypothetical protein
MPRRKNREQRHVWLQRELEASGYRLDARAPRRAQPPPVAAMARYEDVLFRPREPRRRPARPPEVLPLN